MVASLVYHTAMLNVMLHASNVSQQQASKTWCLLVTCSTSTSRDHKPN